MLIADYVFGVDLLVLGGIDDKTVDLRERGKQGGKKIGIYD